MLPQDPDRHALDGQLLTPSDIGGVNRSRVLQAFCDYGPLTRAELAKMAGVTRATIGNIVAGLIDANLIEEGEPRDTGMAGKPGRPLWFGPRAGLSGAVSIEPGRLAAALVNARGEELAATDAAFDTHAAQDEIIACVIEALGSVIREAKDELLGCGIALPGVSDTATGRILGSGPLPELRGTDLVDAVSKKFGVRVLIDNDTRAQALGEKWFGAARQVQSFASIQTGHGIGAALVMNGVVVRGPGGHAGEIGHTTVVVGGERCRCGLRGCWETIAGLRWLRADAGRLSLPGATKMDAAKLVKLAASNDDAKQLLARYADHIAVGLANLMHIASPGLFILHGDAVGGGEGFRELIETATRKHVFRHMADSVSIVLSELDARATLLGAAGLVLSETFNIQT